MPGVKPDTGRARGGVHDPACEGEEGEQDEEPDLAPNAPCPGVQPFFPAAAFFAAWHEPDFAVVSYQWLSSRG